MCYRWLISLLFFMLFFNNTIMSVKIIQDSISKKSKNTVVGGDLALQPLVLKQCSQKTLCQYCLLKLLPSSMPVHIHRKHTPELDILCCNIAFNKDKSSYLAHIKEKHTEQDNYTCIHCFMKFPTKQKYLDHWIKKTLEVGRIRDRNYPAIKAKRATQTLKKVASSELPQLYKMSFDFILNQEIKVNHVL